MDEDALVERLHEIERKLAGEGSTGAEGCRAALDAWRKREADEEFQMSAPTATIQRVLVAWCGRCGITPYRKPRQRRSTVCVRVPRGFMDEVMYPQTSAMAQLIEVTLAEAATRVVERWAGVSSHGRQAEEQAALFSNEES